MANNSEKAYKSLLATWNMQGASTANGTSKWTILSGFLSGSGIKVMSLQECGAVPQSALQHKSTFNVEIPVAIEGMRPTPTTIDYIPLSGHYAQGSTGPTLNVIPSAFNDPKYRQREIVKEYEWQLGSSSRGEKYYIYHFERNDGTQAGFKPGERTNLAILSLNRADEVLLVKENSNARRPTLGIRIGSAYYFSIHAPAFSTNFSADTVKTIEQYMHDDRDGDNASWVIMGDFNRRLGRALSNLHESTRQIIEPSSATQQSGGILDYAVLGDTNLIRDTLMEATLIGRLRSDHTGVLFTPI